MSALPVWSVYMFLATVALGLIQVLLIWSYMVNKKKLEDVYRVLKSIDESEKQEAEERIRPKRYYRARRRFK